MLNNKVSPHDRIRGAADIPMTPAGHAQAAQLGQNFKQNGPLDLVVSADLARTRDTAHAVSNGAPVLETHHLRDMDYGIFTGMRSRDAMPIIHKAIEKAPDTPLPGSPESFNAYKDRITNMLHLAIHASKQFPQARIGLVVNRRTIKMAEGWLANGKTDAIIDMKKVAELSPTFKPGDVFKITGNEEDKYGINKIDSTKPMDPGVYLLRHGVTQWNSEAHEPDDNKA